MNVTLEYIQHEGPSIRSFHFRPEKPFEYTAGQFIELFLPHEEPDERGIKRWFTLSSSPTEELLAITTKFADTSSTFKQTLAALENGRAVQMSEPMGDFVLPKDGSIPLVFIAGGIGVTPYRSMVKWLTDMQERRDIQMIYATKEPEQAVYGDLFREYGIALHNPRTLDFDDVLALRSSDRTMYYLAGPEPVVEAFTKGLIERGIDAHRVVTDYFPNYTIV